MSDTERRLTFGHFADRILWVLLCAVALYAANKLGDMGQSVERLNTTVAVILQQNTESHDRLNKLDVRLDRMESQR